MLPKTKARALFGGIAAHVQTGWHDSKRPKGQPALYKFIGVVNTREERERSYLRYRTMLAQEQMVLKWPWTNVSWKLEEYFQPSAQWGLGTAFPLGAGNLFGFKMELDKFMKRIICCGCLRQQGTGHDDAGCLFQAYVLHSNNNNYSFTCVFFTAFFSSLGLHFYS